MYLYMYINICICARLQKCTVEKFFRTLEPFTCYILVEDCIYSNAANLYHISRKLFKSLDNIYISVYIYIHDIYVNIYIDI